MSSPVTARESRIIGALLGLHAGDSLGAAVEFKSHDQIRRVYPDGLREIVGGGIFSWAPGHATDDADMTRGVLLAYRDAWHDLHRRRSTTDQHVPPFSRQDITLRAGNYFVAWWKGTHWPGRQPNSRPKDIGYATNVGIQAFRRNPRKPSGAGHGSAGNGSLMRCLPTALFQPDLASVLSNSVSISTITHTDPRCTIACAAYNACAAALVDGADPDYAVRARRRRSNLRRPRGLSLRPFGLGAARDGPPAEFLPNLASGYVLETLLVAISAVLDPRSLEDVLVDVVRIGKDTDTNGAVAGGLLGARHGEDAIPSRWKDVLQFGQEFREVALEILRLMESDT
ncbi:unnamed protein product [Clonostachys rosea f. rosea IK726]|uniref:Uncharacterized protein n=1 Tax=Clonostachys rosea f. rosea IK726 TaxID=1349383 RepID=A0ACA9T602_BIOOC|nr:unnamed protein product [Clonostachys rosea f. rosea IK726]